jgi:hypothetical protein
VSALLASQLATATVIALFGVVLLGLAAGLAARNPKISVGPIFLLAWAALVALYLLGSLVDLLPTPGAPEESIVERLLLGWHRGLALLLPLRANPLLAAPLHAALALALYLLLVPLLYALSGARGLDPRAGAAPLSRLYHLAAYGDLRTLDRPFWLLTRPALLLGVFLLGGAFFELFRPAASPPMRPFLFGVATALAGALPVIRLSSRPGEAPARPAPPDEEPEPRGAADPAAWLAALRARGFVLSVDPDLVLEPAPAERPAPALRSDGPELVRELARVLTRDGQLWGHQALAIERVLSEKRDILLHAPPRSGKTTAAHLLAARTAIGAGLNTLLVLRDAETAAGSCEHLGRELAKTPWSQNLRLTASGPEMVQLLSQKRSPALAFTHPEALDRIVSAHRDHAAFLEHLGLLVVEDLERWSGPTGTDLHFVLRRLGRVLEHLRASPRVLATCGVPVRDVERFAETLVGRDLEVVTGPTAPARPLHLRVGSPPGDGASHPAALAVAEAATLGLPVALLGFASATRSELDRAAAHTAPAPGASARPVPPERARASVAELLGPGLPRLFALAHRLGADAPEGVHEQLLLPAADPLSRRLAQDLELARTLAEEGRGLVADTASPRLGRRHLERALAELPTPAALARQIFGARAVADLERDARVLSRRDVVLEGEPPRLVERELLSLANRAAGDRPSEEPVRVVDRATGTTLRTLAPGRAPLVAHPGAILLYRGRRFVLPLEPQPVCPASTLLADLLEEDLASVRVRRLETTVLDPAALRPLSLGGGPLQGGLVPVRLRETISGVRHHARSGRLVQAASLEPLVAEVVSEGRVLLFPGEAAATEPALHALVHLLRPTLAAILDLGEEGLIVAHSPALGALGPALLFVDTHEGGAGYARALDARVLRRGVELARLLLDGACCDGRTGCERCVRTTHCHDAAPDRSTLDRAGAALLVEKILGL